MTIVPLSQPYSMKNATFLVAQDDFTAAVSGVVLTPNFSRTTWRGIGGNTISNQSPSDWTLTLNAAQDLDPAGLQRYLLDHEGEKRAVVLVPTLGGPAVNATITLGPGELGGQADGNTATFSVQMGMDGRPVFDDDYVPV